MRRPSIYTERRGSMEIKMTPMIDVVFLLLVFFVWTASFQIVEQILPSSLSAVTGTEPAETNEPPPPEQDFPDAVVRIGWSGTVPTWSVNGTPMSSLAQVKTQLEEIGRIKSDAPVILHPDANVPLGDVIDAYDVTRMVGFNKVQFATREDAAGSP
jgi:biopolymer transport protein ExbD